MLVPEWNMMVSVQGSSIKKGVSQPESIGGWVSQSRTSASIDKALGWSPDLADAFSSLSLQCQQFKCLLIDETFS